MLDSKGNESGRSSAFKEIKEKYGVTLSGVLRKDVIDLLKNSLEPGTVQYEANVVKVEQSKDKVIRRYS